MSRLRSLGLFVLIAALFGGAFPAIKAGLEYVPPLLFATLRYLLSAVLLLGYAAATTDDWTPETASDRRAVLAGGVFFIGGTGLLFVGQQSTTSGVAAIIYSSIPILTPIAAWFLLPEERLSRRGLLGVLVGFVGVVIVVQPDPASLFGGALGGQLLVLAAAASVTLGTVLVRRTHPSMSIVAMTGWAMLLGSAIQYGFSLVLGESLADVALPVPALLILGYLSVFASGIGFVVYFTLLEQFGPLEINLVSYLMPVVAVVTGWLLLEESIAATTLVGFLVVVAGFVLLKERELIAELAKFRGATR
ncbi:DMT family transporter [Halobacterium wangiae]|uniref:DMT family transporter n=1 Tax=Halobacterium wangiae TaxID=2902623 RepID=UPI001E491612|nr:DMT family transporter [Halobacterium wangiae]